MKIFNLSKLQNAEHFSFITDILNLVDEANIETLTPIRDEFAKLVSLENEAQNQVRKSEFTENIKSLDSKRNSFYRGLVLRLQSDLLSGNENIVSSAKKLKILVDTYGNFVSHNYPTKTTEIQNLIKDFKSETYRSDINTLGINDAIRWLENANNEFNSVYINRRDNYAKATPINLKETRKQTDEVFKRLQKTIEAIEILQPTETVLTLKSKINASIDKWRTIKR